MNIQTLKVDIAKQDWKSILNLTLPQRGHYENKDGDLTYLQVAGRFLGCTADPDDYLDALYTLAFESDQNLHILSETLDKTISNEQFQAIQKIMNIHQTENGLSVNRFVAFMEGEALLPLKETKDYYRFFRQTYIDLLTKFEANHSKGLFDSEFRRVVVDTVKWSWNHIAKWTSGLTLSEHVPRVLWYGDATESQAYFLYFLIRLGYDVLIFHPEGTDVLEQIDSAATPIDRYPSTALGIPFPKTKPTRRATVAKRASVEMDEVLHSDNSLLYRPWQFRDYEPFSITLKTTYDEVFLIAKEKAFIRPNFEVANGKVLIPCLFSKILGISTNQKEYWSRMEALEGQDLTAVYTSFPLTTIGKASQLYHFQEALTNGVLDPAKMVQGNWWRYKRFPEGLQLGLATAISRYVQEAHLKPIEGESLEERRLFLFTVALDLPEPIPKLLMQFDYSQTIPKVILLNDGKSGTLTREDAALILLLNALGFDLLLYNPTGQNDLELFIESKLFDSHWLEEVSFDENFLDNSNQRQGSFLKKIVSKFL